MKISLLLFILNMASAQLVPRGRVLPVVQPPTLTEVPSCDLLMPSQVVTRGAARGVTRTASVQGSLSHPREAITFVKQQSAQMRILEERAPLRAGAPRQTFHARGAMRGAGSEILGPLEAFRLNFGRIHNVQVALATNKDASELRDFIQNSRGEFAESTHELDQDLGNIEANYTQNGGYFLVLRDLVHKKVIGTAAIYNLGYGHAELRKFYIDSSMRNRGLGRELVQHLVEWCKEHQYFVVELETYASMTSARRLYEKVGFKPIQPLRIQRENETISDPGQKVVAYANFLGPRKPIGPETPIQEEYQRAYKKNFLVKFLEGLRDHPTYGVQNFFPILKEELAYRPRAEYEFYERFGIIKKGDILEYPSHYELIERIIGFYIELGLEAKDWILPALVLTRTVADGSVEFHVMTPGIHSWPIESGYEIVDRIPDDIFQEMIRQGFLPLSNSHDFHHFMALGAYPAYMQGLAQVVQFYKNTGSHADFLRERRFSYALESLVLADPTKIEELRGFLKVPQQAIMNNAPLSFSAFKNYFQSLPIVELLEHANTVAAHYRSYLAFYSGAGISPIERVFEERNILNTYQSPEKLSDFLEKFSMPQVFDDALHLPRESFLEDPTFWNTRLAVLLKHHATLSLQEPLSSSIKTDLSAIEAQLRIQLARMEYFAWNTAVEVNHAQWMRDMLYPNQDSSTRTRVLIEHAFGNHSITYRMLFGLRRASRGNMN